MKDYLEASRIGIGEFQRMTPVNEYKSISARAFFWSTFLMLLLCNQNNRFQIY